MGKITGEIADRNKTALTHDVTKAALAWLDSHGFKPIETEVWLPSMNVNGRGWIADIAAVIVPTQTELINMKMLPRRPTWKKPESMQEEWREKYRQNDRLMTCIVEVKTSRNDFTRDRKWQATPPSDLAFIAIPHGIVAPNLWPETWGVLEYRTSTLVKVRNPVPRVSTIEEQHGIIYQIALRRDHRTRHKMLRELAKERRITEAKDRQSYRVSKIIRAIEHIAAGFYHGLPKYPVASVEEALEQQGIRNVNAAQLQSLGHLFKIASRTNKEAD